MNVYEITVERKLRNRFLVEARSSAEAAMKVGAAMAGATPFARSEGSETERRMLNPKLVPGAGSQQVSDFEAGLAVQTLARGRTAPPSEGGLSPATEAAAAG